VAAAKWSVPAKYRLFESGSIVLVAPGPTPVSVCRGMAIVDRDGAEMGKVAAVVLDTGEQRITFMLLGCGPAGLDYRLVPVSLIEQVRDGVVRLQLTSQTIEIVPYSRRTPAVARRERKLL
jgi:sporulation protein YlmC with PRC-barrel domain